MIFTTRSFWQKESVLFLTLPVKISAACIWMTAICILPYQTQLKLQYLNDTINYEIRITEGSHRLPVNNITIEGNDRTNENVIRREIYTLPR